MPELPFLNPSVLKQLELPVPSRETTPQLLMPLNLNQPYEASVEMVSYRRLYGLDALDCDHWQGYVQMPLLSCMSKFLHRKLKKLKVQSACCMVI